MKRLILGWVAALACAPAAAQVVVPPSADPGALQQRRIEEEQRRQEIERLQRKPIADPIKRDAIDKPAPEGVQSAIRFRVREIRFSARSEVFTQEELGAFVREVQGREVTFAELQQWVDRINAEYRKRGVVTAQAVIPPQDVSSGVIQVRLVEGRVGSIRIDGNRSTRDGYISSRIGLAPGELVDLPVLERHLKRFNRSNDAQLRAELKPGQAFATTDIFVNAIEPPRHEGRFTLDNAGSEGTGELRAGLAYTNRSLLGFRDDLNLSTTRSDGLESYSLSYGIPINRWGGRLSASYNRDYTDIRHGPQAPLDITGQASATILVLRQPVYFGETSQLDVVVGGKRRDSTNWISGVFLNSTQVRDVNLGMEYQSSDNRGYWIANYALYSGHADSAGLRDHYFLSRASVRRNQAMADGWSARAALNLQHTSQVLLPPGEQFLIGGEGSVRGYPVGAFVGDQGATLNVELHHPIGSWIRNSNTLATTLTGFFFVDAGIVKPFRPPGSILSQHENLSSLGWGINARIGKNVYGRVAYAYALRDLPLEPRRYAVHFQLIASIF